MLDTSRRFGRLALRARSATCLILPALFLLAVQVASAEPAIPADTPIPVVVETVDSWDVGSGMVYWGKDCFADEFGRSGYLKRRPVAGGTQRTLEVTDGSKCDMPFSLTAEDDGVYYFDLSEDRVERTPLAAPYAAEVVSTPVTADLPSFGSLIDVAGDYVYWPVTSSGKVLRALRSGGASEAVATGLMRPIRLPSSAVRSISSTKPAFGPHPSAATRCLVPSSALLIFQPIPQAVACSTSGSAWGATAFTGHSVPPAAARKRHRSSAMPVVLSSIVTQMLFRRAWCMPRQAAGNWVVWPAMAPIFFGLNHSGSWGIQMARSSANRSQVARPWTSLSTKPASTRAV